MMLGTNVPETTEDRLHVKICVVGAPIFIMDELVQLSVNVAIFATTLVIFPVFVVKGCLIMLLGNNFHQSRNLIVILA